MILRPVLSLCRLISILLAFVFAGHGWAAVPVDIHVEGLNEAQTKNVLSQLSLQQQKDHPLTTAAFIRSAHLKAEEEIRKALEPFGYYRAEVVSSLQKTETGYEARYKVNAGKAVRISQLEIRITGAASKDNLFANASSNFPLKKNDILQHQLYETGKRDLQQLATENGYLDAQFTRHEIQVDLQTYEAKIELAMESGERYHYGEIEFHQDILNKDFLEKYAPIKEGDPYSVVNLLELQKILYDSGYFLRADVTPRLEEAEDHTVPIDILLTPRKPNRYSAGIGYGTDTGARALAGWENRRINRRGHRFGVDLLNTEINNSQTMRYTIPLHFYEADQVTFTAKRFHEWLDDRDEETRSLSVGRSWAADLLRTTIALTYSEDKFSIGDTDEETYLLMPSISWTYIDTDDRLYTTRGSRYNLDIRGAHSAVVSDISFAQVQLKGKWIFQPTERSRLIGRAGVGHTLINEFDELPSTLRFFAGGDKSVRGYDYKSIGPTDGSGDVIGGKNLVDSSIELEHQLKGNWYAAIFYDAGNAFDENDQVNPLKRSAGVGIRWRSPVGLIRLDAAWPQNDPGASQRFHLVIGPDL